MIISKGKGHKTCVLHHQYVCSDVGDDVVHTPNPDTYFLWSF